MAPVGFHGTRELEHAGLITFTGHRIEVPEELAAVVAIGTLMAMARFNETAAWLHDDHEKD